MKQKWKTTQNRTDRGETMLAYLSMCSVEKSAAKAGEGRQPLGLWFNLEASEVRVFRWEIDYDLGVWSQQLLPIEIIISSFQSTERALAIIYVTSSQAHPHLCVLPAPTDFQKRKLKHLHSMCCTFTDTWRGTTNFSKKSNFYIKGLIPYPLASCRLSKKVVF